MRGFNSSLALSVPAWLTLVDRLLNSTEEDYSEDPLSPDPVS